MKLTSKFQQTEHWEKVKKLPQQPLRKFDSELQT